jgi:hypothetical protein
MRMLRMNTTMLKKVRRMAIMTTTKTKKSRVIIEMKIRKKGIRVTKMLTVKMKPKENTVTLTHLTFCGNGLSVVE